MALQRVPRPRDEKEAQKIYGDVELLFVRRPNANSPNDSPEASLKTPKELISLKTPERNPTATRRTRQMDICLFLRFTETDCVQLGLFQKLLMRRSFAKPLRRKPISIETATGFAHVLDPNQGMLQPLAVF